MANQVNFGSTSSSAPPDLSTLYGMPAGLLNQPLETQAPIPGGTISRLPAGDQQALGPNIPQYGTVQDAIQAFYTLSPDQVSSLQSQLYGTPFWTSSKAPVAGNVDDPNTFDAYKNAVTAAARSGQTLNEVLDQAVTGETGLGAPSSGVRVYPGGKVAITETDPETIRLGANAVYQKLVGRDMTDAEAQAVVNSVRGDEKRKGAQQAALDESQREAQIQTNEALYGQGAGTTIGATAPAVGATQGGATDVVAAITRAAQETGVPVNLALAIAQHESGLNPQAVGDKGTSFGLYQLHQGGELGNMSPQQAYDPLTNARTALAQVAAVLKAHPDWSGGQVAAAAQRPADQAGYAAAVNALLGGSGVPVQGATAGGSTGQSTDVFLQPTTQEVSTPMTAEGAATSQIQTQSVPEMQEYGLQTQLQNFTSALHGVPGDTGASKGVKP